MKHLLFILVCLLLSASFVIADDFTDLVGKGNAAVKEGDYQTALDYYHQAEVERPETPELEFNMAGALYHDEKYEEAVDKLQKSMVIQDAGKEASAHYNLGSVYYRMGDFQNAIQSYQRSLELIPEDIDAKYNLELARKMLKEQMEREEQEPQEQDQEQEKKEQDQDQEEQDEQEKQDEEQQDEQQQQDEPKDEDENEEQQPQPQEQNEDEMSKEDAERILNALKDDEKELQKDQQRFKAKGNYQGNDW